MRYEDANRWAKASSELADLKTSITSLLQTKGAVPLSTIYSTTSFRYKNFVFSVKVELIMIEKKE